MTGAHAVGTANGGVLALCWRRAGGVLAACWRRAGGVLALVCWQGPRVGTSARRRGGFTRRRRGGRASCCTRRTRVARAQPHRQAQAGTGRHRHRHRQAAGREVGSAGGVCQRGLPPHAQWPQGARSQLRERAHTWAAAVQRWAARGRTDQAPTQLRPRHGHDPRAPIATARHATRVLADLDSARVFPRQDLRELGAQRRILAQPSPPPAWARLRAQVPPLAGHTADVAGAEECAACCCEDEGGPGVRAFCGCARGAKAAC